MKEKYLKLIVQNAIKSFNETDLKQRINAVMVGGGASFYGENSFFGKSFKFKI